MLDGIKALTFDTGGTILNWHGGISDALAAAGAKHGLERDWHAITNDYRRTALGRMLNAGTDAPASFNIDDVHRDVLAEIVADNDLAAFTAADRDAIWRRWHELEAWPDFPPVLPRLRERFTVASFTILTVSLIVDTARRNGLSWDAVISCEMIGTYKLHARAYETAARWLSLAPSQCLMVACHNFDLDAARKVGFKTALVRRFTEWGPDAPPPPDPDPAYDVVVESFPDLARALAIADV